MNKRPRSCVSPEDELSTILDDLPLLPEQKPLHFTPEGAAIYFVNSVFEDGSDKMISFQNSLTDIMPALKKIHDECSWDMLHMCLAYAMIWLSNVEDRWSLRRAVTAQEVSAVVEKFADKHKIEGEDDWCSYKIDNKHLTRTIVFLTNRGVYKTPSGGGGGRKDREIKLSCVAVGIAVTAVAAFLGSV
nr:hypothetical protein TetV2_00218 [Oceanusvirus sp.]